MSLFLYYAFHSFVNQFKKLFKSWVAIILLCCIGFGLLVGIGAGIIGTALSGMDDDEDYGDTGSDTDSSAVVVRNVEPSGKNSSGIASSGIGSSEDENDDNDDDYTDEDESHGIPLYDSATGEILTVVEGKDFADLIAMGLSVFFVIFFLLMADKTNIFLPADTVLLFTAPIKPQKALMFRICCNLGAILFATVYFSVNLPSILIGLGGGFVTAIAILFTYLMILAQAVLLQSVAFIFQAGNKKRQSAVRIVLYVVIAAVAAGLILYAKTNGISNIGAAAVMFFTNPVTRFIPFVGWTKAILVYVLEENYIMAGVFAVANILLAVFTLFVMSKMNADFYEPAMAKAEEYAQILENQKASRFGTGSKQRTKDRSDKLLRNGFEKGNGANTFFFKEMYNRKRFAFLGFFTKTFATYAVFAIGLTTVLAIKNVRTLIPGALLIALIAFYRTIGNPLSQDTQMHYFSLIPETSRKKLFWSMLGGLTNTALDFILPLIACAIIAGAGVFETFCYFALIISLDFFATSASALITSALPSSTAKPFRQVFSVMFISFGFMPCAVVISLMAIGGMLLGGLLAASAMNILLGAACFMLLPVFIG